MEQEKNLSRFSDGITCEIPLKLPSLNEYIRSCRSNRYAGAKIKADVENNISVFIARLPRFENPVEIDFHWIEGNKKRDLDNCAFAKKFILDALVKCGKLKDDNRRYVQGFRDTFAYGDDFKVILTITEVNNEGKTDNGI